MVKLASVMGKLWKKLKLFWFRRFRRTCRLCKYYERQNGNPNGGGTIGVCVRFPPTIRDEEQDDVLDQWPRVFSEYSVCGEFRRGRSISR